MDRKKGSLLSKQKSTPSQKQKDSSTPITCRSSASHVASVMAKFDERKKELVRSIGFGGLLELGQINRVNRKFSLWLLSQTTWEYGLVEFGENKKVRIVSQDIEKIIGTPASGTDVMANKLKEEERIKFLQDHLSFLGDEHNVIRNADLMVQSDLPDIITKKEADKFKIAFVVFIMGRFLAPTADFYIGNSDFWHVLVKPDELQSYNWSAYVLYHLLDAARLIKFANILNKPVNAINGCPLLLQIFYLDNIDLGSLNLQHEEFPRIKAFDCTILGKMIQADISNGTEHNPGSSSCSKMRCRSQSCYALTEDYEIPNISNATPPSRPRSTPIHKKRAFMSMAAATSPSASPSIHGGIPDFPAYLRSKYPEHLEVPFIDALRYHNAKCIQHVNKSKNALLTAIVNENIYLADKYIQQHGKQTPSGIPKYPRKNSADNRRTYEDLLSGPESGSDAEELNHRRHPRKSSPTVIAADDKQKTKAMVPSAAGDHLEAVMALDCPETNNSLSGKKTHQPLINGSSGSSLNSQGKLQVDCSNTTEATPSITPISLGLDSIYNTPSAISKMAPLSPELSPTAHNKFVSDLDLSTRMLASSIILDLNSRTIDAEYNNSPVQKKTVKFGRFARSHWKFGADHPDRDSSVTVTLFDWLTSTNSDELERSWIMHDVPRFIERKGHDFKKEFIEQSGITYDLFDIAVRRLKQLDNLIYPADIPLRWRHFLESDFAMHSLADENPADSFSIREQFIGKSVDYELTRCRMIFIPVHASGSWWCYALDMREHLVFILDPDAANAPEDVIISLHIGTITNLLQSMKATITRVFDGWEPNFDDFVNIIIRLSPNACKRWDSGFYTLYCMKHFNGVSLHVSESDISKFKHYLLYELFELKHNRGVRPSVYVQTIDD